MPRKKSLVERRSGQIFESSWCRRGMSHYEGLTDCRDEGPARADARSWRVPVRVRQEQAAIDRPRGISSCASIARLPRWHTVLRYSEDPVAEAKVVQAYAKGNDKRRDPGSVPWAIRPLTLPLSKARSEMPSRGAYRLHRRLAIAAPASNIAGGHWRTCLNIASILLHHRRKEGGFRHPEVDRRVPP